MKYRHAFHAGNFADVHKHITLIALLQALARKDKGFLLIDTHAGRGLYELGSAEARRGAEASSGIGRLAPVEGQPPEIGDYLRAVRELRQEVRQRDAYPGSPLLATRFLRPQDRAVFIEAQIEEHVALRRALRGHERVTVEHGDGYERIASWLPPIERRALVLIDPPYEDARADQQRCTLAAAEALRRLPNAVVAVWYPIKLERDSNRWLEALATALGKPLLCGELWLHPRDSRAGLNGSGVAIVNAPYLLEEGMQTWLPALHRSLDVDPPQGGWSTRIVG